MKVFLKKYFLVGLVLFLAPNWAWGCPVQSQPTPIQLISGLPYIEVMINGKGPFLLGFDTGFGAGLELDSELAKELNVTITGETQIGDGSGINEITLNTGTVDSIKIGSHTATNCTAILRSNARKNVPGMENVKGIIGIGLFPEHKVTIDYPKRLFSVEKGSLPKANHKDILDYSEVGGGIPQIKIKVGNFNLNALIDSRSMSGGFKIPQQIAEKLTFITKPKLVGRGKTVSNTIEINEVTIEENIIMGDLVFEKPTITYPALNENVLMGSRLLQMFTITIDSRNKRIQFIKGTETQKNEKLLEYAGQYGDRTITVEGDFLYIQRPHGGVLKMLPISKDEFTLEIVADAVLVFERGADNKIKSIKVRKGNNPWEIAEKS